MDHRTVFTAVADVATFKAVRRRIGYAAANEVLSALAARIVEHDACEIGRIGRTDIEFVIRAANSDAAIEIARGLQISLEQPVQLDAMRLDVEVSIGISETTDGRATDEHFELAELAAEDAVRRPGRVALASGAGAEETIESLRLLADLALAIRDDALELHYMPKLNLNDGAVTSLEALCRWNHTEAGSIPPVKFIGLAEESGMIESLTHWTLDRAIADQRRLIDRGHNLQIDVNLSGRLVGNAQFCDCVIAMIGRAGGKIGLEITETAVIDDPDSALANLRRISAAGIHIAIDDYGAGLSSLTYLRDLPAQELKIDQSFIRKLTTSNRDPLLVRSAIEIARALEMEVTAEGVEDELALTLLSVMRCNYAQGYHISRALPLNDLVEYLENPENQARTGAKSLFGGPARRHGSA